MIIEIRGAHPIRAERCNMVIADFETYVYRDTGKLWDSLPVYKLENIYEGYKAYLRDIIVNAESKMSDAYFMVQDVKNGERGPITKEDRERYNRRMFGGVSNE